MEEVKFFKLNGCEHIGYARKEDGEKIACYGRMDELIAKEVIIVEDGEPSKEDLEKWAVIWLDKLDGKPHLYGSKQEAKQAISKGVADGQERR